MDDDSASAKVSNAHSSLAKLDFERFSKVDY